MDGWVEMHQRLGGTGTLLFVAPDFTWDVEPLMRNTPPMDAEEAAPGIGALPPESFSRAGGPDAFLDASGAVFTNQVDWGPLDAGWLPADFRSPATLVMIASPIGPDGAERLTMAMSASDFAERRENWTQFEEALDLASAWARVWTTQGEAEALYSSNAVVEDSIAGVTADGRDAIRDLISSNDATWELVDLASGGPAVFPITHGDFQTPLDGFVAIFAPATDAPCPRPMAIVTEVADAVIRSERRFWTIAGVRRCLDGSAVSEGWWDRAAIPDPAQPDAPTEDLSTPTEPLVLEDGTTVVMVNGSTALRGLVDWGLGRFTRAGLDRPSVDSVTFTRYSDFCEDVVGRVRMHDDDRDVTLCFDDESACVDESCTSHRTRARRAVLHELGHLWLRDHLADAQREEFTRSVGLTEWSDPALPWAQQAREHAAETIAWGLMDHDMTLVEIGSPAGDVLTDRFAQLTGAEPIR